MLGLDSHKDPRLNGMIMRLVGAADHDAMPTLTSGLDQLAAGKHRWIILDLAGLDFLNSGAIGRLVELRKQTALAGGQVLIASASKYVAECFRLSRLDHAFEMFPTLQDALARTAQA